MTNSHQPDVAHLTFSSSEGADSMIRSLLVGLDGSAYAAPVLDLALRWAKRFDAELVGLGVVDEPGIQVSEAALFAEGYHRPVTTTLRDVRREVEDVLGNFARRCEEAGVKHRAIEDVGTPYVEILREAERSDLILLGRETHFDFGWQRQPDETLGRVVQDSPRPVVVVPESLAGGESVVVAYDGSLQAARALSAFEATGLGEGREVHVVTIDADRTAAARIADRALAYLRLHAINATAHLADASRTPARTILERVEALGAGLLVMGAYGQSALREFFLGSVTREMLRRSPVPVFCTH
jgi:nucleotide-binding universal stress UspA family protein